MSNGRVTNDQATGQRRWGLLRELMERQAEVDDVIAEMDQTPMEHIHMNNLDGEMVTAVVLTHIEMGHDKNRPVEKGDIVWAAELIDHLDTLGFEIRYKS